MGAIIGISVGGLLAVFLAVAAVARWSRKGRDRRYREPSFAELDGPVLPYGRGGKNPFQQNLDQYHVIGGPMTGAPHAEYRGY